MRRIAHVLLRMSYGGAENLVINLAARLMNERIQSNVFCLDGIDANTERLVEKGVRLELIKRRQVFFDPKAAWRLRRAVRREGVTLIHAHDMSSLLYAVVAGFPSIPIIMTEHSRHYIDARLLRRFEKWFLVQWVALLVTVSPLLAEAAKTRDCVPANKIRVIENGVDTHLFSIADGAKFRHSLGLPDDAVLLGMVGRLEEIKGPEILLEAFASLARSNPRLRLVYVGQGSLDKSLKEKVQESGLAGAVLFVGPRQDIPNVMAALDLLVIPSLSEGLPFALLEAMAAGRPVVASSVGFIPDILDNGARGWLVPPGDADALAIALRNATENLHQARVVAELGRGYVASKYSLEAMVEQYEQVYQAALEARR